MLHHFKAYMRLYIPCIHSFLIKLTFNLRVVWFPLLEGTEEGIESV